MAHRALRCAPHRHCEARSYAAIRHVTVAGAWMTSRGAQRLELVGSGTAAFETSSWKSRQWMPASNASDFCIDKSRGFPTFVG